MNRYTTLCIPEALHAQLTQHLFPGDAEEHAAVLAAGWVGGDRPRLLARELFIAREGVDYDYGTRGYKALQASFIHRCITHCRDQRLVYLAVHNHGGSGSVAFSEVDFQSHERGYPALLDIASGLPVGALVVARGAIELDLWMPNGDRNDLHQALVVGSRLQRQYAHAGARPASHSALPVLADLYDRQVLLFGAAGQHLMQGAKVAVIGLGGIGSLLNEYLARLGIGHLVLIDPDRVEASNLSRVVGATVADLQADAEGLGARKIDIAARVARQANPTIRTTLIADDFARDSVARQVLDCDYLFLAADTMRARLVFNAIVHQYFIPGVQLGSKVMTDRRTGALQAAYSVVRKVTPGAGCLLCNQLVDPSKLAEEWKTDADRLDQEYGTRLPNPSVITMNAVSAAHAVNHFLFYFAGMLESTYSPPYVRFNHLSGTQKFEEPRRDPSCTECSSSTFSRYGRGEAKELPCAS